MIAVLSNRAHAATLTVMPWDDPQTIVNRSQPGDTIRFTGTQYNLTKQVNLKGNRSYVGDSGAVIYARFAEHAFRVSESNTRISYLTFDAGGAIRIDSGSTPITGPFVDNCFIKVRNIAPSAHVGIIFEAGSPMSGARITNCTFDPIEGDAGIYGYEYSDLRIQNCVFQNGTGGAADGVHISAHGNGKSKDLVIDQCYGKDLRRNFLEIQGPAINVTVQDCWYEWFGQIPFQPGDGTFLYSLPLEGATGVKITRNVALSPLSSAFPDKIGPRIVWEIGGTGTVMEYNYSRGANHVIAANGANGTGVARNNNIGDFRESPRTANGNTTSFVDNGPGVLLPVDLLARGRPAPNRVFGSIVQSVPTPTPTTVPASQPTPTPTTVPTTVPSASRTIVKTTLTWTVTYSDGSTEQITRP
jgi:hypothetical protein